MSENDFDPLNPSVSIDNVVAIRKPLPDWMTGAIDELKKSYLRQVRLFADVDTIKVRKTLNENEDNFVQAVVTYYLSPRSTES